jgi:hypothetical protein
VLRAIHDVEAGKEAPHVIRNEEANRFPHLTVVSEVITDGSDWQSYWKNKLDHIAPLTDRCSILRLVAALSR